MDAHCCVIFRCMNTVWFISPFFWWEEFPGLGHFRWHFKHFFVMCFGALTNVFLTEWNGNCSTVFHMGCTSFHAHSKIMRETSEVSERVYWQPRGRVGLSMCVHQKDLHQVLLSVRNSGHLVENRTKDVNRHCTLSNSLISCPVINMWKGPQAHDWSGKCKLKPQWSGTAS